MGVWVDGTVGRWRWLVFCQCFSNHVLYTNLKAFKKIRERTFYGFFVSLMGVGVTGNRLGGQ